MYFDPMTGPHFPVSLSASLFWAGIWAFVKTVTCPSLSELASYGERLSPISLARSWEPPNLLWARVFSPPVRAQSCKLLLPPASICGAAGSLATSSWILLVLSGPTEPIMPVRWEKSTRGSFSWACNQEAASMAFTESLAEGHLWTWLLWVRGVKWPVTIPVTTSVRLLLALCWLGWL